MEVFKEILDTHTKICTCRKIYKVNEDLEITVDQKENKVPKYPMGQDFVQRCPKPFGSVHIYLIGLF